MVHGTAARFLITCLEPVGHRAVFAMLKCSGGDTLLQQTRWEMRQCLNTVNQSLVPTGSPNRKKIAKRKASAA